MTLSKSSMAKIAFAQRVVRGLDEAGTSMTIDLDHLAEFTSGGEPWPEAESADSESADGESEGSDEADGNGGESDEFKPSSYWLTVSARGFDLEIWEGHSDTTLNGNLWWPHDLAAFQAHLDQYSDQVTERLQRLASSACSSDSDDGASQARARERGG